MNKTTLVLISSLLLLILGIGVALGWKNFAQIRENARKDQRQKQAAANIQKEVPPEHNTQKPLPPVEITHYGATSASAQSTIPSTTLPTSQSPATPTTPSTPAPTTLEITSDTTLPKGSSLQPTGPEPDQPPVNLDIPKSTTQETTPGGPAKSAPVPVANEIVNYRPEYNSNRLSESPENWQSGRYLYRNTSPEALEAPTPISGGNESPSADINLATYIPESQSFLVAIKDTVYSSETEIPVKAAVVNRVVWNGRVILDPYVEVLGVASPGKKKDRLRVTWQKILLFDGRTITIHGIATHTDGTLGVKGYPVGDYLKALAGPLISQVGAGILNAMSQQNQITTTNGFLTTTSSGNATNLIQQGAENGASKAFQKLTDLLMQQVEEDAPYVVIIPGTLCKVYLTKYLDTSKADYGE